MAACKRAWNLSRLRERSDQRRDREAERDAPDQVSAGGCRRRLHGSSFLLVLADPTIRGLAS
jgi:hypothetical protein